MKKIKKRERFFEVTLSLIHEKGFKATTMRDIAQELNFEVANVYNYIDSKQALLETYLFDIQNEFHNSMDLILDSTHSPKEKLSLVVSSYIQITAKKPLEQSLLANEWRNLKEPRRQEFVDRRRDYENKLKTIILQGVAQGQFRALDEELTTHIILSTLRWLYIKFIPPETRPNPVEIEKQLVDFILPAIAEN